MDQLLINFVDSNLKFEEEDENIQDSKFKFGPINMYSNIQHIFINKDGKIHYSSSREIDKLQLDKPYLFI